MSNFTTAAAIGIHSFWGLSASFDCVEAFSNIGSGTGPQDVIRVLLVHPVLYKEQLSKFSFKVLSYFLSCCTMSRAISGIF